MSVKFVPDSDNGQGAGNAPGAKDGKAGGKDSKGSNKNKNKDKKDQKCEKCNKNGSPSFPPNQGKKLRERMKEHRGVTGDTRSQARGRRFENAAANHNRHEIERMERSLASIGGSAMSWGSNGATDQKIGYTCSKCGKQQAGEIEHIGQREDGSKYAAEAKNEVNFNPALDPNQTRRNTNQMEGLSQMASSQGMDVIYKVPARNTGAAAEIAQTARELGLNNVSVIPI